MSDIQKIIDKYNILIFEHISFCNKLIQKTTLSNVSNKSKILTINSIKSLSTSLIRTFKTLQNTEIENL
jgi:hypothetical protein